MNRSQFVLFSVVSFLLLLHTGCYRMRGSNGGGQIKAVTQRTLQAADIALPPGYRIESVASGLTFPTAVVFDESNNLYVVEAGYSYGEVWEEPKLLKLQNGNTTLVAKGQRNGPWTGATWYNGDFYIAEGGELEGGRILKITKDGVLTPLLSNLPSMGDHHTNGPVIKDGYIYFGQGTATNAGVVGTDNAEFGWLPRRKEFHDIPCKDVVLAGQNYTTDNILTPDATDKVTTGAFVPYGQSTTAGQVIKGALPCTGSILRMPLNGQNVELVAWGLRNPFGLAFAPDGRLFVTDNAFDERGSRPVWGAADVLWEIQKGAWYGWPDFSAGKPISGDEEFKSPTATAVKPLLQQLPSTPPKPAAQFGVHASASGFDFSRSAQFGYSGEAFVAQFGDMAPSAGKVLYPVGFKIVRTNIANGVVRDFATNKGKRNGPASWLGKGGLERPVSVKFDVPGTALYVVDFGVMRMTKEGPQPQTKTGTIWKITKQ